MNLAHMTKWDDDILLKNFIQHLQRIYMVEGGSKHKANLTKHHRMLKEIKRRMNNETVCTRLD